MFTAGDVVFVVSDQAQGYRYRNKFHVCVCGGSGRYFFVNSASDWPESFRITHDELPALPNAESYVSCSTLLIVPDAYMVRWKAELRGHLPREVILRLIDHIEACSVLTDEEKEIAINGLSAAC